MSLQFLKQKEFFINEKVEYLSLLKNKQFKTYKSISFYYKDSEEIQQIKTKLASDFNKKSKEYNEEISFFKNIDSQIKDNVMFLFQLTSLNTDVKDHLQLEVEYYYQYLYYPNSKKLISKFEIDDCLKAELLKKRKAWQFIVIMKTNQNQCQNQSYKQNIIGILAFSYSSQTQNEFKEFFIKLFYKTRYGMFGIIQQVKHRFDDLVFKIFKQIICHLYMCQQLIQKHEKYIKNESFIDLFSKFLQNQNYLADKIYQYTASGDFLKELQGIVYKTVISFGVFPFFILLNNMNTGNLKKVKKVGLWFKQLFSNILIGNHALPWSSKFHASLQIGSYQYSFNENKLSSYFIKEHLNDPDLFYLRFKMLDYFPLDQWIVSLSEFFQKNIQLIISSIDFEWHNNKNKETIQNFIIKLKKQNDFFYEKLEKCIKRKINKQDQESIFSNIQSNQSSGLLFNKKQKSYIYQRINQQISDDEENISAELLNNINNFSFQSNKKEQNEQECKIERLQLLHDIVIGHDINIYLLKKEQFEEQFEEFTNESNFRNYFFKKMQYNETLDELLFNISIDFFKTYYNQLIENEDGYGILPHFARIRIETDLNQYNFLLNNCQTPTAALIYQKNHIFNSITECLLEEKFQQISQQEHQNLSLDKKLKIQFIKNDQIRYLDNFFAFSSFSNDSISFYLQPAVLTILLDYFETYGDSNQQLFLRKVEQGNEQFNKLYDFEFQLKSYKLNDLVKHFMIQLDEYQLDYLKKAMMIFYDENQFKLINIDNQVSNIIGYSPVSKISQFQSIISIKPNQISIQTNKLNDKQSQIIIQSFNKNNQIKQKNQLLDLHQNISFLIDLCQNKLLNEKFKKHSKIQNIQANQYQEKEKYQNLLRELNYIYYNSIRLKNSQKLNKDVPSLIGNIVIKNPKKKYSYYNMNSSQQIKS